MDNKNHNITTLDVAQMQRKLFDESHDAQRVIIVGSDFSSLRDGLNHSITEALKNIQIPSIIHAKPEDETLVLTEKTVEYREIDRPYIVTEKEVEYRTIEVPVIVKELQLERIEVPVYIEKVQIVEKEIPVYVEKQMPLPNWVKVMLIAQSIALIAVLIFK